MRGRAISASCLETEQVAKSPAWYTFASVTGGPSPVRTLALYASDASTLDGPTEADYSRLELSPGQALSLASALAAWAEHALRADTAAQRDPALPLAAKPAKTKTTEA